VAKILLRAPLMVSFYDRSRPGSRECRAIGALSHTLGTSAPIAADLADAEGDIMSDPTNEPEKGAFFTAKNILAIVIAVAALVFVFSNLAMATLNLFGARITMPGWIWLVVLLAIGFIIGSLFPWFRAKRK